ncbi:MAG TPA: 2-dehydropantoate 2-reductase [Steroidobacter sp.]|nr:2-dehydropantoate 2-reductase [Steroidobacter sp.]
MNILIVGAGAIGSFYGSALARQGARVSVVVRSDYELVGREGYTISSALLGDHRFRPHQVYREPAACHEAQEIVLLTTKVLPDVDRVSLLRTVVGPRTVIGLIQNGLDVEKEIAAAFPDNEILSGLAFIAAARNAPGRIHHYSYGSLTLGRYPHGESPTARKLAAMFEASKVKCMVTNNVVTARWRKAVWNAPFNPISILGGALDTQQILSSPEAEAFVRRAMQEVCDAAAANGHPLSPEVIDDMIASTRAMPAYKTSMALDYENGRPLEIEPILGAVIRAARAAGVDTPALESIYAIVKMIEAKRA